MFGNRTYLCKLDGYGASYNAECEQIEGEMSEFPPRTGHASLKRILSVCVVRDLCSDTFDLLFHNL